jgi:superfamily II DNA/RNA helicase
LIRREKRNVLNQLPHVQQFDIPIALSPAQAEYHASYARGIATILQKKFLTAYDIQKLHLLLANMRMVCDSTYLVDEKTNVSPKMEELERILFYHFDLTHTDRKIIIFSEWIKVHKLIGQLLRKNKIGFTELNGKVPVKLRGDLIKKFENDPKCKIFLSTQAGGAGLNLQVADTLFNFELPWNPAKKSQRIGRIDRLGQRSNNLTIYNLITKDSIEQQIAAGLLVKQNLFEGVLDSGSKTDYVDFSSKGRSQFIDQLEAFINQPQDEADGDDMCLDSQEEITEQEKEFIEDIALVNNKDDDMDKQQAAAKKGAEEQETTPSGGESKTAELEQVMTSGMQFLAGLYKMSTGKEMGLENQQIKINKETGEVTMTFKLPV